MNPDIHTTYRAILLILSIGLSIAALEDLKAWSVFHSKGLLSWKVSRLSSKWLAKGPLSKVLDILLDDKGFKTTIFLRIGGSGLLFLLALINLIFPFLLGALLFLNVLIAIRSPYSLDGAYQMNLILLFALSIGAAFGIESQVSILCLWFVVAELIVAYFISGITKLFSPIWRKPYALNVIFSTRTYGHGGFYQLIQKSDVVAIVASWSVFLFEALFFTVFFFPSQYAGVFLIIGASFHFFNAFFMGLNSFFFAFLATYPALLYCVNMIH